MRKAGLVISLLVLPSLANAMSVDWEWKKEHRCNNLSPALAIAGVPDGVKTLAVKMNDLDFQNKDHGGDTVEHTGGDSVTIPEGGLKSNYLGPCPNNFSSFGHNYQITVRALAADGSELAKAMKTKEFSAATAK